MWFLSSLALKALGKHKCGKFEVKQTKQMLIACRIQREVCEQEVCLSMFKEVNNICGAF